MRLILCGLLAALTVAVGGCRPLDDGSIQVTAMLDDTAGLFVGNDVGVLGVPVGEIVEITPKGDQVAVDFTVSGTEVAADVGAVVVARSVATDRYLELTPADAPGPRLADGATIPIERTRTPAEFDEVLAGLKDLAAGLRGPDGDAASLRALLSNGADALDGRGAQVRSTVADLATALEALSERRGDITGTIGELDQLTGVIAANEEVVDQFAVSVSDATSLFADESEEFGRALDTLRGALRTLAAFVRDNRDSLRGSTRALTRTTGQLLEHQESLEEAVEVLPLTFDNIDRAIVSGRLQVKLPLQYLSSQQAITEPLCAALPARICDQLGTDPDLMELLGALIGGDTP